MRHTIVYQKPLVGDEGHPCQEHTLASTPGGVYNRNRGYRAGSYSSNREGETMAALELVAEKPPLLKDEDGIFRVGGTRVRLDTVISHFLPMKEAIETVQLLAECSLPGEWEGQVRHLPL